MERIKMISEAFSMQPTSKYVTELSDSMPFAQDQFIKEIKLEEVYLGIEPAIADVQMMYVGYNYDDKKMFQFIAKTVNVEFF